MSTTAAWAEANQKYLVAHLARISARLEGRTLPEPGWQGPGGPPAMDVVCTAFGLSPFERDMLLLAAGAQLDSGFRAAVAAADPGSGHPSFGMALATLDGAAWEAITPGAPLRYWRLVDLAGELTTGRLTADEAVVHFLAGVPTLDPRLDGVVQPDDGPVGDPPPEAAAALVALRTAGTHAVQLLCPDRAHARATARAIGAVVGSDTVVLDARDIPGDPVEREWLARLVERQTLLLGAVPVVLVEAAGRDQAARLAERLTTPVLLVASDPVSLSPPALLVEVPRERASAERWSARLGDLVSETELRRARTQFPLDSSDLEGVAARVRTGEPVWRACRAQRRTELGGLAMRVKPRAGWDRLVVPEGVRSALEAFAAQVRHRGRVHDDWGWRSRLRGTGISALFAGPSGTGKTLAAEVVAAELDVDLYVVDLSAVVDKYIGETEKNLRRVFDAAESSGAILLFDEADALFGKRSEVRDSHDRYANLEVSYLLQRMEHHDGATILTTNHREALDPAFTRRLRFTVTFPFPDAAMRAEIWRRVVPAETPADELPIGPLAQLSLSGGQIFRTALNATFAAAADGGRLTVGHLAEALRRDGDPAAARAVEGVISA
ncbi:ATPase family associated with various cellular activities (AAA) [Geodermatophilus obscurus]|uniref:ATPase family associated with various cellular activities (AAA) n=1 Tax=Geodermatophilus obscurus TaxID=1861 RepID=A0A1M7S423_9ACTN|nr:ATP-binding protein [Geodermatophilus obscurus]SHN53042.1 ATPase family associated with various cellular activities (AAA) [Geodermatophilus obscurus]